MLFLSDPRVAAVPVRACGEPLVDVRQLGELLVDHRKQDPAGAWSKLCSGVLGRLLPAEAALPDDVHLLVIEGHRPAALQSRYFDDYAEELREANPSWPR